MKHKKLGKKARKKGFNSFFIDDNWAGLPFMVNRKTGAAFLIKPKEGLGLLEKVYL